MSKTGSSPSPEQMSYLRSLAIQRGESFAWPQTGAEASVEIERLLGRGRSSIVERRIERDEVSHAMAARGGAAAVCDREIVGYGSSARWR